MNELKPEQVANFVNGQGVRYIYFYTPLCGTCQLASKMLEIVNKAVPNLTIYKCDINYSSNLARQFEIESVPCLAIWTNGIMQEKIYAFRSVHYIYETVKKYE